MTFACAQYEEERKITKYCTIYFFNAHHTHLAVAHMGWAGEGLSYFCPRPRPPYGACVDPHMGVRGVGGAGSLSILVSAPLGLPLRPLLQITFAHNFAIQEMGIQELQ